MFGISGTELFVIVVFVLLIFGPDKLPGFGRTVGQIMREFKRAQSDMEAIIKAEMLTAEKKQDPAWSPEGDEEGDDEEGLKEDPASAEEVGGWVPGSAAPTAPTTPAAPAEEEGSSPDGDRKEDEEAR